MLAISKNEDFKVNDESFPYHLLIDRVVCEGAGVYVKNIESGKYGIFVLDIEDFSLIEKLRNLPLADFFEFQEINFYSWSEFDNLALHIKIDKHQYKKNEGCYVEFYIKPNFSFWKHSFSFAEYQDLFTDNLIKNYSELNLSNGNNKYNEFSEIILFIYHEFANKSIEDELLTYQLALLATHKETIETLQLHNVDNLLLASFDFPEELKIPCEQYLLYFAQFLRDLGINATSNLKEEAGKVLFSVTPTDGVEALDKIRDALAVYLNLPSSPISGIESSENFALMRLQQQVRNLQHSQQMAKTEILSAQYALGLAQQNIDNQNQTIVQQNSVIENLGSVIEKITNKAVMIDSVENKEEKEEFIEICEGLRIGESKWLRELTGIGLNSAKFINARVKNTFGKDDEKKSVLGLDEKD